MAECHEPADEDCHWHSIGIGPMRIQRAEAWRLFALYRRSTRGDVFCGMFSKEQDAQRIARILATVPDEAFA